MAAPSCGRGMYSAADITSILTTALCSFSGAVQLNVESGKGLKTVIHSGNWGCGAFGGNPVIMLLCQMLGAELAGVSELHLHSLEPEPFTISRKLFNDFFPISKSMEELASTISALGFQWGHSDGN